jgi:hypothetical protein
MTAQMTFDAFRDSLRGTEPPELGPALRALWWDGKGDWDRAHDAAQEAGGGTDADRVHAYLHRKEGDLANARYWYSRVRSAMPAGSLDEEWSELVRGLLDRPGA